MVNSEYYYNVMFWYLPASSRPFLNRSSSLYIPHYLLQSPRKKQQQQQQPILPDEEGFHPSANGRKGHKFHELYLKTKEQVRPL